LLEDRKALVDFVHGRTNEFVHDVPNFGEV